MPITYEMVKTAAAELYGRCLKKIPEDTKDALRHALDAETNEGARKILAMMLHGAQVAEDTDRHVCSDAGVPVYFVKIGTAARIEGNIKQAMSDGFDHLVATIQPPILKHVTNPLTQERSYKGKDMPMVSYDLIDGADYVEITCQPKALGSGRWAALEIFSFPDLATIEKYVMDCVLKAGSQHCPPVVIGVGIGGTFDHCAKIAKLATLRPFGQKSRADPRRHGGTLDARREPDRLWPHGHGWRHHGARGPCRIRVRPRLHAGGRVFQLLDQPARQRPPLRHRRDCLL